MRRYRAVYQPTRRSAEKTIIVSSQLEESKSQGAEYGSMIFCLYEVFLNALESPLAVEEFKEVTFVRLVPGNLVGWDRPQI